MSATRYLIAFGHRLSYVYLFRLLVWGVQIEATDKSASIRVAFSAQPAAEDLSRKLRGVTVKIKGVKLHAFVRVGRRGVVCCVSFSRCRGFFFFLSSRSALDVRCPPRHRSGGEKLVSGGYTRGVLADEVAEAVNRLQPHV